MNVTRVFLVDDHRTFVDGMASALPTLSNGSIQVVGLAYSGEDAMILLEKCIGSVDVVVTDYQMGGMNGIELGIAIKQLPNPPKVMMLTMFDALELVMKANRNQLDGFAPKASSLQEIIDTINDIQQGTFTFEFVSPNSQLARLGRTPLLTKTELQILKYIVKEEYSTTHIAELMNKSVHTIDTHRRNIGRKIGVQSVVGFVKYAYAIGMLY